jgi:NAD(P)-dependent dehydrogenase (short-subunit alcohol dehydrogenase family)
MSQQSVTERQKQKIESFIVIGASRGLGAALVDELLKKDFHVVGVSRTAPSDIPKYEHWKKTGNFEYHELDIGSPDSTHTLEKICAGLPASPLCIIYNAAIQKTEVDEKEPLLNMDVFFEINQVQIDGLGRVIRSFEKHLLKHGRLFASISSFSAYAPAILDPRIAYPASKAYLDMAMKCLNAHWNGKIKGTTIHLGHFGGDEKLLFIFKKANYQNVAQKIIKNLTKQNPPEEINYPLIYCLAYKYFFRLIPYSFDIFASMISNLKKP